MNLKKDILPELLLFGLFFLMSANNLEAQPANRLLKIGISGNAFTGDLQDNVYRVKPGIHFGLQFNGDKKLNGAFGLGLGSVVAQDPDYSIAPEDITIKTYVQTNWVSLNLDLKYKFIESATWQVYVSQGFGMLRYKPYDEFKNPLQDFKASRVPNESYSNITLMLPTQLGAIYFLNNGWGLGLQFGILNPLTDYLDNIAELGTKSGNDNIIQSRLSIYVPLVLSTD